MDTAVVEKTTRGVSPLLLVIAVLAFLLLPVVGVSCNTSAALPALGPAISSLGGGSSDPGQLQQAQHCLQDLSGRDVVSYSGTTLAFGGTPHVDNSTPAGCSSPGGSSPVNDNLSGVGVQPLFLAGFILVIVAVLATVMRAPLRNLVIAGTALVAFILMLVGVGSVHGTIANQIDASTGSNTLSSVGLNGTISSFFDVHAAIGLWLVIALLLATVVVNAGGALLMTTGSRRVPPLGSLPPPLPPPEPPPPFS